LADENIQNQEVNLPVKAAMDDEEKTVDCFILNYFKAIHVDLFESEFNDDKDNNDWNSENKDLYDCHLI